MEKTEDRFNVRVYGIMINDQGEVLVSDEKVKGDMVTKFPGGGVHYHEGLHDALIREMKEELHRKIHILDHIYTTDFYLKSWWDGSTVLNVYYSMEIAPNESPIPKEGYYNKEDEEVFRWVKIKDLLAEEHFKLPTDLKVYEVLKERSNT